jgi:hypothetical protein
LREARLAGTGKTFSYTPTSSPPSSQPYPCRLTRLSIVDLNRVPIGSEHRIATHSRLGASTDALQVLGRRQALALGKVGEEQVDVGVEALDLLAISGQEREDRHGAVGALVHVPFLAGDGGGCEDFGVALGIPAAVMEVSFVLSR